MTTPENNPDVASCIARVRDLHVSLSDKRLAAFNAGENAQASAIKAEIDRLDVLEVSLREKLIAAIDNSAQVQAAFATLKGLNTNIKTESDKYKQETASLSDVSDVITAVESFVTGGK